MKARREQLRVSQADIALRVGLLRTSITNIEAGRQKPPLHVLYDICEALRLEVADVLPTIEELRPTTDEEIAAEDGKVWRVPSKTAEFLRELIDEPMKRQ